MKISQKEARNLLASRLPQSLSANNGQVSFAMLINIEDLSDCLSPRERIVVIGSGAVGLHLAALLASDDLQVVVVESGERNLGGFQPESYQNIGIYHEGIVSGRSRTLGGTTNLWGGQLVEFMPIDFEDRDWLEGSSWPVGYHEIASFYRATYEALGIRAEAQCDEEVWGSIRKSPPELSGGLEVFLTRWMKVPNLAELHRSRIEADPNLLVVTGCTVVGFQFNGERVTGIEAVSAGGWKGVLRGNRFVLAAGTIENVRLLLHEAQRDEGCPWASNQLLGRRFQDHLGGRIGYIKPCNYRLFYDAFCTVVLKGNKFQPKLRTTDSEVRRRRSLNIQAMIAFESSISENLVFLKQFVKAAMFSRRIGSLPELMRNMLSCSKYLIPLIWKYIVEHRMLIPSGSRISLLVQSEMVPLAQSRILVDSSVRDQYGLPKVLLDWRISGRELQDIRDFAERVSIALAEAGLATLEIDSNLLSMDPKFLEQLKDTGHQAGGCIMGKSAEDGVVDADLRIFRVDNLYVAGACVFPTSSNANTTFTALALATRLADHLIKRNETN